jgi:hypothetical protein
MCDLRCGIKRLAGVYERTMQIKRIIELFT